MAYNKKHRPIVLTIYFAILIFILGAITAILIKPYLFLPNDKNILIVRGIFLVLGVGTTYSVHKLTYGEIKE